MFETYVKCPVCGHCGRGENSTRGSILIELILRLCFLIPGLIYSIWRYSERSLRCPKCKSRNVIKISKNECLILLHDLLSNKKLEDLGKITLLKNNGTISQEEFDEQKIKIENCYMFSNNLEDEEVGMGKIIFYILLILVLFLTLYQYIIYT